LFQKTARVAEEIVVGKQAAERTKHLKDTVGRTDLELEELDADVLRRTPKD
jgi:stress response protein YsnF